MAIRVLIINRQLAFSVALKQALERTGAFDVHPFTTADAAIEYLQAHPQDVVLLDFGSAAPSGAHVVETLQGLQPGIAIVASPHQSDETMRALGLQESIEPPFNARDVIPLLNRAVEKARSGAAASPPAASGSETGYLPAPPGERVPRPQTRPANTDIFKHDPLPPSPPPPTAPRLRPGEIDPEQLRPYMISSDVFHQRQKEAQSEPRTEEPRRRPGEFDPSQVRDLGTSTDIFKEGDAPEAAESNAPQYTTEGLKQPSTEVLHTDQPPDTGSIPPLERPRRRRTNSLTQRDQPSAPPSLPLRPGEYSEQDLLNLALNRANAEERAEKPRERPRRPGDLTDEEIEQYRISTDIFKDNEADTSALSSEDAAAMWEQLSGDESAPGGLVFEFVDADAFEDDEGDTPFELRGDAEGSAFNDAQPRSLHNLLEEDIHASEILGSERSLGASDWGFPEEDEDDTPVEPEMLERSRRPTDTLPPELAEALTQDDLLSQQYEVEALFGPSVDAEPRESLIPTAPLAEDDQDYFEPPTLPKSLLGGWEDVPVDAVEVPPAPWEIMPDEADVDDGLERLEAIADEIRRTRETGKLTEGSLVDRADEVFQKLAAEEPPLPEAIDDGGTVGDLREGVHDPAFQNVLQILRGEEEIEVEIREADAEVQPTITQSEIDEIFASFTRPGLATREQAQVPTPEPEEDDNPAQLILETALDESTPADVFSLDSLIANIERQLSEHKPSVRPLPSWSQGNAAPRDDLYVREPEFLAEVIANVDALPEIEDEDAFGDATTYSGSALEDAQQMETEYLPSQPAFPPTLPEENWSLEPARTEEDTDGITRPLEQRRPPTETLPRIEDEEPQFSTEFERLASFNLSTDEADITPPMGMPVIQDPYIAQIALSLTQISLEEIAAAILTRHEEVVALAGRMGRADIEEIRAAIHDQWDPGSEQANIRFITLPSSGRDYMLHSRRTVNDLTLSLVFQGSTPLRDIRRQSKRLIEALMTVPDPEPAAVGGDGSEADLAAVESGVRGVYTYVWMLKEPNQRLNDMVARAIEAGMRVQLQERSWQVLRLAVGDEYVYLMADVPGEAPPYETIRDLKQRSASIVRSQNPSMGRAELWADSYLIVTPGRELDAEEIQQFIHFERMM